VSRPSHETVQTGRSHFPSAPAWAREGVCRCLSLALAMDEELILEAAEAGNVLKLRELVDKGANIQAADGVREDAGTAVCVV
jgi:hypothetical protein